MTGQLVLLWWDWVIDRHCKVRRGEIVRNHLIHWVYLVCCSKTSPGSCYAGTLEIFIVKMDFEQITAFTRLVEQINISSCVSESLFWIFFLFDKFIIFKWLPIYDRWLPYNFIQDCDTCHIIFFSVLRKNLIEAFPLDEWGLKYSVLNCLGRTKPLFSLDLTAPFQGFHITVKVIMLVKRKLQHPPKKHEKINTW